MTISNILNENVRDGKTTENDFVKLTSNADGPRVALKGTKTKVTYNFLFDKDVKKKAMSQTTVLKRLIKEGTGLDMESVNVEINISENGLYKQDAIAIKEIPNDNLWNDPVNKSSITNVINEKDLIEVKKETHSCKAFYAETFKLSSSTNMQMYKNADKIIQDNYNKIVDSILSKIKTYIETRKQTITSIKTTVPFPHKLAVYNSSDNYWIVSRWTEAEFWKDLRVKKVGYGKDNTGRPIPRIQFHFNDEIALNKTENSIDTNKIKKSINDDKMKNEYVEYCLLDVLVEELKANIRRESNRKEYIPKERVKTRNVSISPKILHKTHMPKTIKNEIIKNAEFTIKIPFIIEF